MSRTPSIIHVPGEPNPPAYPRPLPRRFDWVPWVLAGLALAGQVYMEATHNDKANAVAIEVVGGRTSKLEGHREDDNQRLNRIEDKVDKVLDALRAR